MDPKAREVDSFWRAPERSGPGSLLEAFKTLKANRAEAKIDSARDPDWANVRKLRIQQELSFNEVFLQRELAYRARLIRESSHDQMDLDLDEVRR